MKKNKCKKAYEIKWGKWSDLEVYDLEEKTSRSVEKGKEVANLKEQSETIIIRKLIKVKICQAKEK